MSGVNKVILVGNLGKDPETRYSADGAAITNITIATSERWKDKTGEQQERTEWHRVVFFGKLAEIAGQYLKKGSQVYVEGALRTRKWQGQDGKDNYTTEVVANEMQMLGSKGGSGSNEYSQPVGDSNTSRRPDAPQPASSPAGGFDQFDDDIPF